MKAKWIVITEVIDDIDPASWSYVNGTRFISSTKITGEVEGV